MKEDIVTFVDRYAKDYWRRVFFRADEYNEEEFKKEIEKKIREIRTKYEAVLLEKLVFLCISKERNKVLKNIEEKKKEVSSHQILDIFLRIRVFIRNTPFLFD